MTREDAVELLELFRRGDQIELPPVSPLVLARAYVRIAKSCPEQKPATATTSDPAATRLEPRK